MILKLAIFIFILNLLFSTLGFSESCYPVNLVTDAGSPFQNIPVYDQNGSGTCYAFAVAQLVNYYQLKNNHPQKLVHPAWIALNAKKFNDYGGLASSNFDRALDGLESQGNCNADYISKALGLWAKRAQLSESRFLAFLDGLSFEIKQNGGSDKLNHQEFEGIFKSTAKNSGMSCTPGGVIDHIRPHLDRLGVINSNTLMSKLILPECRVKAKIKLPDYRGYYTPLNRRSSGLQIQDSLFIFRYPVGISYCSNFLKNPGYQGVMQPTATNHVPLKSDCASHASIIVGKKPINGQCHLLLRNSWGSGFSQSTKNYKCLCRHKVTKAYVDNCTAKTHNNGEYVVDSCWVPESQINANTYRVTKINSLDH